MCELYMYVVSFHARARNRGKKGLTGAGRIVAVHRCLRLRDRNFLCHHAVKGRTVYYYFLVVTLIYSESMGNL